jgi:hypothetical protein
MAFSTPLDSRIAVELNSKSSAHALRDKLLDKKVVPEQDIVLLDPNEQNISRKVEENSDKVARTMGQSHALLAIIGLAVSLAIAYTLIHFGPAFTANNPVMTYIAAISPGIFIGLFVAGIISLKPYRDSVNLNVYQKLAKGKRWLLVVDSKNSQKPKASLMSEIEQLEVQCG